MLRRMPSPTLGRPRKLTHSRIIEVAVQVLEDEGFNALTMRALAQRLGVNHATLYNYVGHIEDVETEAVESLMKRVPIPSAESPAPMRQQLIDHLLALREVQFQHPHVLHAPIGSLVWRLHVKMHDRVLHALAPRAQSLTQIILAYNALTALMATSAERARVSGIVDHAEFIRAQRRAIQSVPKSESEMLRGVLTSRLPRPRVDSLAQVLSYLIDRLLPDIDRRSKRRK